MSDESNQVELTNAEIQLLMYAVNGFYTQLVKKKDKISETQVTELRCVLSKLWKVLTDASMVPITSLTIEEILNGKKADASSKYNA